MELLMDWKEYILFSISDKIESILRKVFSHNWFSRFSSVIRYAEAIDRKNIAIRIKYDIINEMVNFFERFILAISLSDKMATPPNFIT